MMAKRFTDVQLKEISSLEELCTCTLLTGKQAKEVLSRLGVKKYKFTNIDKKHGAIEYGEGVIRDVHPLILTPASKGGLYVALGQKHFFKWTSPMKYYAYDVEFLDNEFVYFEPDYKCKTAAIELSNCRPIHTMEEWNDQEIIMKACIAHLKNVRFLGVKAPLMWRLLFTRKRLGTYCELPADPTMLHQIELRHLICGYQHWKLMPYLNQASLEKVISSSPKLLGKVEPKLITQDLVNIALSSSYSAWPYVPTEFLTVDHWVFALTYKFAFNTSLLTSNHNPPEEAMKLAIASRKKLIGELLAVNAKKFKKYIPMAVEYHSTDIYKDICDYCDEDVLWMALRSSPNAKFIANIAKPTRAMIEYSLQYHQSRFNLHLKFDEEHLGLLIKDSPWLYFNLPKEFRVRELFKSSFMHGMLALGESVIEKYVDEIDKHCSANVKEDFCNEFPGLTFKFSQSGNWKAVEKLLLQDPKTYLPKLQGPVDEYWVQDLANEYPSVIEHVENPSEAMQLKVLARDPTLINKIKRPCRAAQLLIAIAMEEDGNCDKDVVEMIQTVKRRKVA